MRDAVEWAARAGVFGALVMAGRMVWKQFWRMVTFAMRPDLYDRVNQALEWERSRVRELELENDRLRGRKPDSGDGPCDKPNGTSSSKE